MARLLVNPRSEVRFDGWRSDTFTLGQRGWRISIQENIEYGRFEMMLEHQGTNLIMHAQSKIHPMREHQARSASQWYNEMHHGRDEFDGPPFDVIRVFAMNPNLKVFHEMPVFFDWSETRPRSVEVDLQSYNPFEFPIFQRKGQPEAQELIVEPKDVLQLLEQIKQMQAPEQADIRRRNRQREAVPLVHASILSFGEAA
jgi:hypothetical protein